LGPIIHGTSTIFMIAAQCGRCSVGDETWPIVGSIVFYSNNMCKMFNWITSTSRIWTEQRGLKKMQLCV